MLGLLAQGTASNPRANSTLRKRLGVTTDMTNDISYLG